MRNSRREGRRPTSTDRCSNARARDTLVNTQTPLFKGRVWGRESGRAATKGPRHGVAQGIEHQDSEHQGHTPHSVTSVGCQSAESTFYTHTVTGCLTGTGPHADSGSPERSRPGHPTATSSGGRPPMASHSRHLHAAGRTWRGAGYCKPSTWSSGKLSSGCVQLPPAPAMPRAKQLRSPLPPACA